MARRKESGIDVVASMPWPAGIVLGLIGYIAIRYGVGWYFGATNNPYLSGLGKLAASGIDAPLGWMLLTGCWFAAVASFFGHARRRRLLDTQSGIGSLRDMNWREFEMLAGEAFRRQGYAIAENGLGGADGGIDLILRKDGRTTLVQCKQWRNRRVDVKVVREMFGVLVHEGADAMKIVALGDYTPDARRFAQGKPIELIDGGALLNAARTGQRNKAQRARFIDTPLALIASMAACLLMIAVLSPSSPTALLPVAPMPAVVQAVAQPEPPLIRRLSTTSAPHSQAVIYASESHDDEQLREWKRRNAESMKILEKTTKKMPLR